MSILADTFGYNDTDNYILEYVIDIAYDVLRMAEEYTNKTLNFIANP